MLSDEQRNLVKFDYFLTAKSIPLVIKPAAEGVQLNSWAAANRVWIDQLLLEHRALLFRDFSIQNADEFDEFIKATSSGDLMEYRDRSSPRHEVGEKIYTSTDYPHNHSIFLHNEGTYWMRWPQKIYFCCVKAAERGGETPIADCRRIYRNIDDGIKERFREVMYVRNYNDGFGLPWETVFQTTQKSVVEDYCRRNQIEYEWKSGERLRTRAVRPTVAKHPQTREPVWFNHATFFHVTTLEPMLRDALLQEFAEDELPYNTYYGDGSRLEPSVLEELREAYEAEKVVFDWQEGDVLLLDNMSVAHGRRPFAGERKVLVGMVEPVSREQ
ncbi:MAG TPA: TauD/TfdA family dioxygenase [Pyrinomonadaceae bacterium]|jgi:alpha-ketoglutarate-dependent taurine dioxygenase